MELETTVNGQSFYESGLAYFTPTNRNIIGLPGLGPAATKKCISFGLISAECVFGQYLAFRRNREVFLDYLENIVGVTFVSNGVASKDDIKKTLCNTLDAKYDKLKEY